MIHETETNGIPGPVVTIHQPNFAPWPGYYHKMLAADRFIYLDNVPFSKNSFQNRNKIIINGEARWLTVPVQTRGSFNAETRHIRINEQSDWRRKHLATLRVNYGKSRFFSWVYPRIEKVYGQSHRYLMELCLDLSSEIRDMLRISTPLLMASDFAGVQGATERLVALVRAAGGVTYLSGKGGRKYLDIDQFKTAGIHLEFQDFKQRTYPQTVPSFISNLSTLDLLFNLGPDAAEWIRGDSNEK